MPGSRTSVESLGELGDRTISKVKRRVLPLIVFLYFIAFLDRNNVGFAKLTMSEDLGLSATAFGFGAGMFFIGYAHLRDPQQRRHVEVRCPQMDRPDPDHVGFLRHGSWRR